MNKGFSLIELLVVIVIIAMLVGVAAPYYSDYVKESKISKAKADLDILRQAVILYNSREDFPYQGPIATVAPYLPLLGDNDFMGLQGQYLTNIPLDPWSKNYKLDPYGGFIYSDGPNSSIPNDDLREYYVKELALRKIEWEDYNGNRIMDSNDLLYVYFNKALWTSSIQSGDFDVYENNAVIGTITLGLTYNLVDNPGYSMTTATPSMLICRVAAGNTVKLGVHSVALKDDLLVLQKYQEVVYDRMLSNSATLLTKVEINATTGKPLRFAVRTSPIKIVPKN